MVFKTSCDLQNPSYFHFDPILAIVPFPVLPLSPNYQMRLGIPYQVLDTAFIMVIINNENYKCNSGRSKRIQKKCRVCTNNL